MRFQSFSQVLPAAISCACLAACASSGPSTINDGRVDVSAVTASGGGTVGFAGVHLGAGDSLGNMLYVRERLAATLRPADQVKVELAQPSEPGPVDPAE